MDENSAKLVEWLKKQPKGVVIEWHDDGLSPEQPWCVSWVDVQVPEAKEYCGTDCPWTIFGQQEYEHDEDGSIWKFVWPHDLDFHSVFNPNPPPTMGMCIK